MSNLQEIRGDDSQEFLESKNVECYRNKKNGTLIFLAKKERIFYLITPLIENSECKSFNLRGYPLGYIDTENFSSITKEIFAELTSESVVKFFVDKVLNALKNEVEYQFTLLNKN